MRFNLVPHRRGNMPPNIDILTKYLLCNIFKTSNVCDLFPGGRRVFHLRHSYKQVGLVHMSVHVGGLDKMEMEHKKNHTSEVVDVLL